GDNLLTIHLILLQACASKPSVNGQFSNASGLDSAANACLWLRAKSMEGHLDAFGHIQVAIVGLDLRTSHPGTLSGLWCSQFTKDAEAGHAEANARSRRG